MPTSSRRNAPDWGGAELWFGDDRCVPADDARSNQRLVQEALLDRVLVPPVVHPIPTRLRAARRRRPPTTPSCAGEILDLVLLGLGPDGHTASLFPHAPSLEERERLARRGRAGPRALRRADDADDPGARVGGHTSSSSPSARRRRTRSAGRSREEPSPATPASLVRSRTGATTAILDDAAAALLP